MTRALWRIVTKFDAAACAIADRHYSRRKPGSGQFMPPGQTLVLLATSGDAVFGWWRPHPGSGIQSMNRLDGWTCTIFRNERTGVKGLSTSYILEAERVLLDLYSCGPDGLLTYVWRAKLPGSNPGLCFKLAGWQMIGTSARGEKDLLRKAAPASSCAAADVPASCART